MLNNISKIFVPESQQTKQIQQVNTAEGQNPFLAKGTLLKHDFYGKNNPVKGGYFAGYYNNKPNIVGQKIFIEI